MRRSISLLLHDHAVTCKNVQKFLGLTNFSAFAVPPARLHSCSLQSDSFFHSLQVSFSLFQKMHTVRELPQQAAMVGRAFHLLQTSSSTPSLSINHHRRFSKRVGGVVERTLQGSTVAIHCNNKTAVTYTIWEGGTKSRSLMKWTRKLWCLTDKWCILLRPAYLPGMANLEADALSRGKRVQEWALLPHIV